MKSDTHLCSAEQGNQVKVLNTFPTRHRFDVMLDSVAVSMEYISFLRKQVTGPRNRAVGKAGNVRRQPSGSLSEHTSQKTYISEVVPPQADGFQAMGRRWFLSCRFCFSQNVTKAGDDFGSSKVTLLFSLDQKAVDFFFPLRERSRARRYYNSYFLRRTKL